MRRDLSRLGRGLVAVLALLATATACTPLDDAMVAIFGRSMRDQRSFDPYENPRLPAENSVAFADGNYPAQVGDIGVGQPEIGPSMPPFTPADLAPPGSELVRTLENPVEPDSASLARGEVFYDRYCAVCHGPQGMSAQAPIIEKLPVMNAYNLATGNAVGWSDGYLYAMVRQGRGAMPGYGHRIPHWDRWHVVNYVRQLQRAAGSTPATDAAQPDASGQGGS